MVLSEKYTYAYAYAYAYTYTYTYLYIVLRSQKYILILEPSSLKVHAYWISSKP